MNGKRIMIAAVVMLVIAVIAGAAGSVLFGEQKGGAADLVHLLQIGLLGVGVLTLVVGAVAHLVAGRGGAA